MRIAARVALALIGATLGTAALAAPAAATPKSAAVATPGGGPGGVGPGGAAPPSSLPTCVDEHACTIVKDTQTGPDHASCTGYSSQSTPPMNVRVLVRTGGQTGTYTITDVPFEQYVEDVLPNEWTPSWDFDALKAGAVAVKSYAWYWVTHFGGIDTQSGAQHDKCFDVTDDYLFQTYNPGSRNLSTSSRTNKAVAAVRPYAARVNGQILQTSYQSYLHSAKETCGEYADGTTLSQYGTQACNDPDLKRGGSLGDKWNVILAKYYAGLQLATTRQLRTPDDFTYAQTSTRVAFNSGRWAIDDGYGTTLRFGEKGDTPAVTDSGDGFAHIGVFRPSTGTWYQATPTGGLAAKVSYGQRGDVPIAGHYHGLDQPSVLALYRPSTRTFYIRGQAGIKYGDRGDVPVPGDYNGDGRTDIALYRPSTHTFWIRGQAAGISYGAKGDVPLTGDYNGDGRTDIALYRPSTHTWYARGHAGVRFGSSGITPIGRAPLSR